MSQDLLSIAAAAEILGLHPKTCCCASSAKAGLRPPRSAAPGVSPVPRSTPLPGLEILNPGPGLTARATTIVDIEDLTTEEAQRIVNGMQAVLNGPKPRPIQIETAYDLARRSLKLVLIATPRRCRRHAVIPVQLHRHLIEIRNVRNLQVRRRPAPRRRQLSCAFGDVARPQPSTSSCRHAKATLSWSLRAPRMRRPCCCCTARRPTPHRGWARSPTTHSISAAIAST